MSKSRSLTLATEMKSGTPRSSSRLTAAGRGGASRRPDLVSPPAIVLHRGVRHRIEAGDQRAVRLLRIAQDPLGVGAHRVRELVEVLPELGALLEHLAGSHAGVADDLAGAAHGLVATLLHLALDLRAKGGGLLLDAGKDALTLTRRLVADLLQLSLDGRLLAGELATELAADLVGLVIGRGDDLIGLALRRCEQLVDLAAGLADQLLGLSASGVKHLGGLALDGVALGDRVLARACGALTRLRLSAGSTRLASGDDLAGLALGGLDAQLGRAVGLSDAFAGAALRLTAQLLRRALRGIDDELDTRRGIAPRRALPAGVVLPVPASPANGRTGSGVPSALAMPAMVRVAPVVMGVSFAVSPLGPSVIAGILDWLDALAMVAVGRRACWGAGRTPVVWRPPAPRRHRACAGHRGLPGSVG